MALISTPGFRFRLGHKIFAIGGIGIVGLLLIAGIYFTGISSMARYQAASDRAGAAHDLTKDITFGLLKASQAEKDFLLRKDEKFVASHAAVAATVAAQLDRLRQDLVAAGHGDLARKAETVDAAFDKHVKDFDALADASASWA